MLSKTERAEASILFKLAIPQLFSLLAQCAMGISAHLMTKWYSEADFCALTWAGEIWSPFHFFVCGVFTTFTPILATLRQSKRTQSFKHCLWQLIWLSAILSLVIGLVLLNCGPWLDQLCRLFKSHQALSDQMLEARYTYLWYLTWGCPAYFIFLALKSLPESLANTALGMKLNLLGLVFNLPLSYCLIFGKLGFPEMGGAGAGLATAGAYFVMLLGLLIALYWDRENYFQQCGSNLFRMEPPALKQLFKQFFQGSVKGCSFFLESSVFLILACVLTQFGKEVFSSHQVVYEIYLFFYLVPCAFGTAAAVRSGSLIGSGETLTLLASTKVSLKLSAVVGLLNASLLFFNRARLIALFDPSPTMANLAYQALALCTICQLVDSVQVMAESILRAHQAFKFLFVVNLVSYWGIALPLIYVLLHGGYWSQAGYAIQIIWIGLIAGFSAACGMLLARLYHQSTLSSNTLPPQNYDS